MAQISKASSLIPKNFRFAGIQLLCGSDKVKAPLIPQLANLQRAREHITKAAQAGANVSHSSIAGCSFARVFQLPLLDRLLWSVL